MKILVTGGAGFIGSNLTERLVEEGHKVVVLDNINDKFSLGKIENLEKVKNKITFVDGDLRNEEDVNKAGKGCEVIFNQAAASSSPMFHEDVAAAVKTNTDGFVNVLECGRKNNAKVIYASTSSVYGNNPTPLNENQKIIPPNIYAVTKFFNENVARLYNQLYGIHCIGLRYMSVYGHNEKGKGEFANLASQFLWKMQNGEKPVLYGDGSQKRDFTFVKDIVKANVLAIKHEGEDVFNVGTGESVSLIDLVGIINKILGTNIEPEFVENKVKNYINDQKADLTKIREKLGYEPEYDLEKGLREIS